MQASSWPETARSYAGHIEDYLVPHIGPVLLSELRRSRVRAMFAQIAVAEGMAWRPVSSADVTDADLLQHSAEPPAARPAASARLGPTR
jgi:hypothetical protein